MASAERLINVDALKREIADGVTVSQVAEALGVDLQQAGDQWTGLCPLHEENTPSFYTSDVKGVYHCFGCKAGGDAIDLVERVRNLGYYEALRWLAQLADIDISDYERPLTEAEKEQERFRTWCEDWLAITPDIGLASRLPSRVSMEVVGIFGAVIRTGNWDGVAPSYFNDKRYLLDGVILPWRTASGRLVGWRVREHAHQIEKRVIGTPNDFPLGKLNEETLFGIQHAREHMSRGRLSVVEGEYDTMALHAQGIRDVVGMGGSTITAGQMAVLESLRVREIVVVFDGDDGGRLAARALAEKYWSHNIMVRVASCPEGEDPESLLQHQGDWAFQMLVEGAPTALEFLLRLEWSARDRGTLSSKLDFVKWIRETYGGKLRHTEESLVLAEVARWLQIPEVEIRDFVRSGDTSLCAVDSERVLMSKACRDKQFYLYLRGQLVKDDFFVLKHQRLWDMLADMLIDDLEFDPVTVEAKAQGYGIPPGYIEGLWDLPDANLEFHKEQIADLALRRSARDDALTFRERIVDSSQPAEALVADLTHRITSKALRRTGSAQRQLPEQVDEAMDTLHERMRNPTEIHGLDLGAQYPTLTRTLQGLQSRRLVLLSAISGMGKSTMMITWSAALAIHQSIPVDLVSLEMDETEILYKLASHMTGIDSLKISGGSLESDDARKVEMAMERIRTSPLHIWAPDGLCGSEFLLYARESVLRRRTRAFFLDYVQLTDPEPGQERENGYKQFGDFGRLCKMKVARAMEVAVVCCAQLNRNAASKERPTKEDMGDSYALVRHSDVIMVLNGQEDTSTVELWVDKNRQGRGGNVLIPTIYDKPINTFREAGPGAKQPEYLIT